MPKISLIITSHNQPDFIRRLLGGIRDYPLFGLEVIVSDDVSTDNTIEVAAGCLETLAEAGAETRILPAKTWGGAGGARNRGAAVASGEYLWFFDGDDEIQSGAIPRLFEAADAGKDCICFGFSTRTADRTLHWLPPAGIGDEFIGDIMVAPWCKIIRRAKFTPFRERCSYEDFDWWFRQADLLETLEVVRIEAVVYDRTSGGSCDSSEWLLANSRRVDKICGERPYNLSDFIDHPEILREAKVNPRAISGRLSICAQMWDDIPNIKNPVVRNAAITAFKRSFGALVCP